MENVDPLALNETDEKKIELERQEAEEGSNANWEHQELAQVKIRVIRGHSDSVNSCQFLRNDKNILTASADATVVLWDTESGSSIHTFKGHKNCATFAKASPISNTFISGGWDKKVNCWDLETGQILWSSSHAGMVTCGNFSQDGTRLVTGSDQDYTVRVLDAASGSLIQEIKDLHKSTITSVQFTPSDDRIVSTSMDRLIKFYDCVAGTVTLSLNSTGDVHINVVSSACFTKHQHRLATVSWDKAIAVWDISTGMFRSKGPTKYEKAHEGSISSCCFSPDDTGSLLVTGGYDNTVALWDVETMTQTLRLQGHTDWVEDVSFSQDSKWLLSCGKDHTVRMWNIEDRDNIPNVIAGSSNVGVKMLKCSSCAKQFAVSAVDSKDSTMCVFCRLQDPERNIPTIEA